MPYPQSAAPIPAEDYTIQIVVTKADTTGWHHGTVVDYTGLDGCGLLIELNNGTVLEPAVIEPDYELKAGEQLIFKYEEMHDMASICMAGLIIKITDIQTQACDKEVIDIRDQSLDNYPTDPINLMEAWLSGSCLKVKYGHSGGCKEHEIQMLQTESKKDKAILFLSHEDNGDMCEAYITDTLSFNMQPLIEDMLSVVEIRTEPGQSGSSVTIGND